MGLLTTMARKWWGGSAVPVAVPGTGRDMTNYFAQIAENYRTIANSFWYYRHLIDEVRTVPQLQIVPLQELMQAPSAGTRILGLRHDVDADPLTALRCARYLARFGIGSSFYLLHTAVYYGEFYGHAFVRTPPLSGWIKGFIVAGCELGLHNDSLGVYTDHGHDGIEALRQEVAWFHAHGVRIRGTVAHNSGPVYGAENFEIFSGRTLWDREVRSDRGGRLPLGGLREQSLGLTYEGTFAKPKRGIDRAEAARFFADRAAADLNSESWMRRYLLDNPCCEWGVDYQAWLLGRDRWVIAGRFDGRETFQWDADLTQVLRFIRDLPAGSRSVLVLHPEYVRAGD